jgi:hypothetical protein
MQYTSTRRTLLPLIILLSLVSTYIPFEVFNIPSIPEAQADISTGLVGHWKFDNTTNDSAGTNHGTFNGGTPSYITGKLGQALSFDGSDDYVNLNTPASTFISASTGSISLWIKPQGSAPSGNVWEVNPAVADAGAFLGIHRGIVGGADRIWVYNWDGSDDHIGASYVMGEWVHIVWVHANGTLYGYKNGTLFGSTPSGNTTDLSNPLAIGSGFNLHTYTSDAIDEVRVYNRALSSSDIAELYNATASNPQCSDSLDNDSDGLVDYPSDPGCISASDNDETDADTTPPSTPTLSTPTVVSSTQLNLSWSASTDTGGSGLKGYRLERCQGASCTTFTQIAAPTNTTYNDTSLTANTTYRYRARAEDNAGNLSSYSNIVQAATAAASSFSISATPTTVNTNSPITVSWTAPSGQTTPQDWVAIYLQGATNQSYNDWKYTGGATSGSLSLTTPATAGTYEVRYLTNNSFTDVARSNPITVTQSSDATPPTVSITAPTNGATVSNTVTVSANASDNVGVAGVQFFLDGANLGAEDTAAPYSVSWNTTAATNGSHTLTACARDAAGNQTTSSPITVTVSNTTTPPPSGILAFPSAEGEGKFTKGGRGGVVCQVTNLNDSGSGSLRSCLEMNVPRTVVFRVGGEIRLNSFIQINNPFITIAGQTAPGDGIVMTEGTLFFRTWEVIVRHLRIRHGFKTIQDNALFFFAPDPDIWTGGETAHDLIFDHNSISWATDDLVAGNGSPTALSDLTFQWNIVSEGLNCNGELSNCGSRGFLTFPMGPYSVHHNLFAHNSERHPALAGDVDVVNNVAYNYGWWPVNVSPHWAPIRPNYVANYFKAGSHTGATSAGWPELRLIGDLPYSAQSSVYMQGNISPTRPNNTLPECSSSQFIFCNQDNGGITVNASRFNYTPVATTDAFTAYDQVLANAGATKPRRDPVDTCIINDVTNGTGDILGYPSEVGGLPTYNSGTPYPDADADGMSDTWETSCGLNPSNAADGAQTAPNGYTNLENFINKLAGDTIPLGDCGGLGGSQPLVGDLNSDGTVNALDWGIMNSQWFTSNPQSDINADGLVNSIDFGLMNVNWGLSS